MIRSLRLRSVAALALAAGLAAGCHPTEGEIATASEPAFQSETVVLTHEIYLADDGGLDEAQQLALARFLAMVGPQPGETVLVSAGGPAGRAHAQTVAAALGQRGVRSAQLVEGGDVPGPVEISVYRTTRLATGCLQADDYAATAAYDLPPLGCANDYNLARMVENPLHLFVGRVPGPAEAGPAAAAVERYRSNTITPLIIEDTRE